MQCGMGNGFRDDMDRSIEKVNYMGEDFNKPNPQNGPYCNTYNSS